MAEIITDLDALHKSSETITRQEKPNIIKELSESIPETALGLSAPQIGLHKRAFIANLSSGSFIFINPKIEPDTPVVKVPSVEACLSLPGVSRCIERDARVTVSAEEIINRRDGIQEPSRGLQLKGLDSCIVQHELDHLNGILIIDHAKLKTREEKCRDAEKQRKTKVRNDRLIRAAKSSQPLVKPKLKRISPQKVAKLKKQREKQKRTERSVRRRQKISVKIQERYRAEQEGLFGEEISSQESL